MSIPALYEQWAAVREYEGSYEVSNLGRVRNVARHTAGGFKRERILKHDVDQREGFGSYHRVTLSHRGNTQRRQVHILVLEAFVGPQPIGHDGCHNDGDPDNNALSNLRWDTKKNNNADKILHGTHQKGSANPAAKLTESCVERVRDLLACGVSQKGIAQHMDVSHRVIWNIDHGRSWRHAA